METMADNTEHLDLTVLLPAFNEEEAITPTLDELKAVLHLLDCSWEILVVNDSSTDKTAELAEALGARVITRMHRAGAGAARRTGILAAKGDIVLMMDADGSYDPSTIPEMLTYFPDYDQVNGARHKEMGTLPLLRAPVKWLLKSIASFLSGYHIPDLNTGLKAFKKDLMTRYLWVIPDGFSCVTTMTLAFLCNDHAVKYVSTTYRKRIGKSKFHPVKDTGLFFMTIIRMIMYFKPLSIFIPATIFIFSSAVVKSIYELLWGAKQMQQIDVVLFVLSGVIMMVGLLADLIVSTQKQRVFDYQNKNK